MYKEYKTVFIFGFIICSLLLGITGCEKITQIMDPPTSGLDDIGGEITIGVVLPLTGRHESTFGQPMKQALELARNEINNRTHNNLRLKFIVEDNTSTVEGAIEVYNKLIHEDRVSVILGPATSSATKETFPIAQENQIVAISPTSAARGLSAIGDFVFRIALTTDVLIPSGVEVTHAKLNYQKVATLYDETDLFSIDSDKTLRETFAAKGIELLTTETFKSIDTDFSEQLARIKEFNPDAIFVSSLPPEKPGILLEGRELGITAPFILRTLTEADVEAAGEAAEGVITFTGWGTAVDTTTNQDFVGNYQAAYGMLPNNYTARSYVTLNLLAEAIANAKSTDSTSIRDALANINEFDTIFGKFSFDPNGDAIYDPIVLIVKDGKLEIFE